MTMEYLVFLREKKVFLSSEIPELAIEKDISKRTMETAKKELGIKAKKINNGWYWLLDDLR